MRSLYLTEPFTLHLISTQSPHFPCSQAEHVTSSQWTMLARVGVSPLCHSPPSVVIMGLVLSKWSPTVDSAWIPESLHGGWQPAEELNLHPLHEQEMNIFCVKPLKFWGILVTAAQPDLCQQIHHVALFIWWTSFFALTCSSHSFAFFKHLHNIPQLPQL